MIRRSAIKSLAILAGGVFILPACSGDKNKASIQLNHLNIDADQEKLLAEITETLIPETDSPGAKSLKLHLFVMKMVDDCYSLEDQQKFVTGLTHFEKLAKEQSGNSFINCPQLQREVILDKLETGKSYSEEVNHFYKIIKSRTIQGYLNSKYVMTEKLVYELVPGRYNGYFPVKKA
jgi:hypothetical protein